MKQSLSIILVLTMVLMFFSGCGIGMLDIGTNAEHKENSQYSETNDPEIGFIEDGIINGTNAQDIEDALKAKSEYNFPADHSLIQSQINGEWNVDSSNNSYNNYTKSYSISANENLEVKIASFATYDNDIDFLLYCVSFFETSHIKTKDVQQWIKEYSNSDGYVTMVFGDAEFNLHYGADNDPTKFELTIIALD